MSSPFERARPFGVGTRTLVAELPLVWPALFMLSFVAVAVSAVFLRDANPTVSISLSVLLAGLLVGFLAELVDGTIGMAYGVTSNSFLLALGLPPAVSSATVHTAEIFTTAASGASHWRCGNVDRHLFLRLLLPGCVAACLGAYVLVNLSLSGFQDVVNLYLLVMGGLILVRSFGKTLVSRRVPSAPLAAAGGFLDATGGGGWGPIVTTTLVANGSTPSTTIGSVNAAEFFVTFAQSIVFLLFLGIQAPEALAGLLVGGFLAAPLGAHMTRRVPHRPLMLVVAVLIIALSLWRLVM